MKKVSEIIEGTLISNPRLDGAFLSLEYGEWDEAKKLFDEILRENPRDGLAYLGRFLAKKKASDIGGLVYMEEDENSSPDYQRMIRFSDDNVKAVLAVVGEEKKKEEAKRLAQQKALEEQKDKILLQADSIASVFDPAKWENALDLYRKISGWKDADEKAKALENSLSRLDAEYKMQVDLFNACATEADYTAAAQRLRKLGSFKHAADIARVAEDRAKKFHEGAKLERAAWLVKRGDIVSLKEAESIYASIAGQEAKLTECRRRMEEYCTMQYSEALRLMSENKEESYSRAIQILNGILGWRDAQNLAKQCEQGIEALRAKESEKNEQAETGENKKLEEKPVSKDEDQSEKETADNRKEKGKPADKGNKNRKTKIAVLLGVLLIIGGGLTYFFVSPLHNYLYGRLLFSKGNYDRAIVQFEEALPYRDSDEFRVESVYQYGLQLMNEQKYDEAKELFLNIKKDRDCTEELKACERGKETLKAIQLFATGEIEDIIHGFSILARYDDNEAYKKVTEAIRPYFEKMESGEDLKFNNKTDIGEILLEGIERTEVRAIIKEHPAVAFSLISYVDHRYADVALYYEQMSGDKLSSDIEFDLELMRTWSGMWIGEARGFDAARFEVLEKGLLTPFTVIERSTISDITHLYGTGRRNERYDFKREGDMCIYSYTNGWSWRRIELHRNSRSVLIDPVIMSDEVNSW